MVEIRDSTYEDISLLLDYIYRSPPGFLASIGVDSARLPSELANRNALEADLKKRASNSDFKLRILTVVVDGVPIGHHSVADIIEGDSAVFHASIWNSQYRGKGIGSLTYPRACKILMDRFELKKIVFKTPIQNIAAIRIKEKLGIPFLGEELADSPISVPGTRVKIYALERAQLERILNGGGLSALQLAQSQLDAYNRRDVDSFVSFFNQDVEVFSINVAKPMIAGGKA